jgi:predicted XRE-type DNA-binding protein
MLPECVRFEHAINKANLRDVAGAELARRILTITARRRPTQAKAAKLLGIDQPKESALTRGNCPVFPENACFIL